MKYRVGEVQNMTDGRDFHSGFNILNSRGAPIVTFSYLDGADAVKARALVEHAACGATPRKFRDVGGNAPGLVAGGQLGADRHCWKKFACLRLLRRKRRRFSTADGGNAVGFPVFYMRHFLVAWRSRQLDQRDQELLEKQLRAINPGPRHDGVTIVTLLVGFLAGITLGGFLVGHTSEPMRVASNDVAPTAYPSIGLAHQLR